MTAPDTIPAFKAFDPGLSCLGFRYEVGKTYEHDGNVKLCEAGFHACLNPFDTLSYRPLVADDGRLARFGKVTLSGETDWVDDSDTKIAAARIAIDAELHLPEFIKAGIDWLLATTKGSKSNSGDGAQIGSSGDGARIGSSGDGARIGSSGDGARIGSSGDWAQIGSSGYGARIGSSGDGAQIGSSGDWARIVCQGENAVVVCAGVDAIASGPEGTWLSMAEYNDRGECVGFATGCIGTAGLKPNTPYRARGGRLVEVGASS